MGARMYDPELGRFISPDSIVPDFSNPQSLNRYSYVLNNALKYTDPTGHRWVKYSAGEVIDERTINTQYAGEWDTAKQARNTAIFETAVAVGDTLLAMANEPYDWVSTASRCTQGECNWLDYTTMALPFVPGAVGRIDDVARAADKIDDVNDTARQIKALPTPDIQRHHLFPQKFKSWFSSIGIDIDAHTVELSSKSHLSVVHGTGGFVGQGNVAFPGHWNNLWETFIGNQPNATAKEVYQFAGKLMDEFGLNNLPIVPYQ